MNNNCYSLTHSFVISCRRHTTSKNIHEADDAAWRRLFRSSSPTMDDDGRLSYHLPKLSEGAYLNILYTDETLRIVRSSHDMLYVFARVPYFPDE